MNDLTQVVQRFPTLTVSLGTFSPPSAAPQRLVYVGGTVQITYRAVRYNIPVRLWIMSYYPAGPPVVYVRPTENMCVNPKHDDVDAHGQVHIAELMAWDPARSSLPAVIERMVVVFSVRPPVYARPRPAAHGVATEQEHQELVRRLVGMTRAQLRRAEEAGRSEFEALWKEVGELEGGERALRDAEVQVGEEERRRGEEVRKVEAERAHLRSVMEENRVEDGDLEVDDAIMTDDLTWQVVDCVAADAALQDCLEEVSRALEKGVIGLDLFLKETKRIATEQYMARATKIMVRRKQAKIREDAASAER